MYRLYGKSEGHTVQYSDCYETEQSAIDEAISLSSEYPGDVFTMTKRADLIQDGESLVSARYKGSGTEISIYDDGFGPLWISRDSMGINGIVRAQTWEDAYGICEDEFFPEASETIDDMDKEYPNWPEDACWSEAFGFRPNGPNQRDTLNHGIYAKDLNGDYLDRLTQELLDDLGIELTIESDSE